jgi:hypothetical protein
MVKHISARRIKIRTQLMALAAPSGFFARHAWEYEENNLAVFPLHDKRPVVKNPAPLCSGDRAPETVNLAADASEYAPFTLQVQRNPEPNPHPDDKGVRHDR